MASSTALNPQTFAKLTPHPFLLANLQQQQQQQQSAPHDASAAAATKPRAPTRTNGRKPHEPRALKINASSLSHAHGSAMVRIGDTSVICGVRGELLPVTHIPHFRPLTSSPAPHETNETTRKTTTTATTTTDEEAAADADAGAREMRDYDLLVPNIELATGCAPQFLPGQPPSTLAQTLSTRVYTLLHGARVLDVEDLRVWYNNTTLPSNTSTGGKGEGEGEGEGKAAGEGVDVDVDEPAEVKAYWTLYIDVLFVSLDGNPFDAAWVAILAALRDTKLPRAWWDADREMVLCSRREEKALRVTGLPVACTAVVLTEREREAAAGAAAAPAAPAAVGQGKGGQGGVWILVDPDREEEKLCEESITIVVDKSAGDTRIRGIEKVGGRTLGPREIRQIAGLAETRWEEFSKELLK